MIQKKQGRVDRKIKGFMLMAAMLLLTVIGVSYAILKQTVSPLVFWFSSVFSLLSAACLIASMIVGIWVQRNGVCNVSTHYQNVILELIWSAMALFLATFFLYIFTYPRLL